MTVPTAADRRAALTLFVFLGAYLVCTVLASPASGRTTHVVQDRDDTFSGEGKPHDWDAPQGRNSFGWNDGEVYIVESPPANPTSMSKSWNPEIHASSRRFFDSLLAWLRSLSAIRRQD